MLSMCLSQNLVAMNREEKKIQAMVAERLIETGIVEKLADAKTEAAEAEEEAEEEWDEAEEE